MRSIAALAIAIGFATSAQAFEMSNGSNFHCAVTYPYRQVALENFAPVQATLGFTGFTHLLPSGQWLIEIDPINFQQLPPIAHDFLLYHECAHAQVPTSDEIEANARALLKMRADHALDPEHEQALAQFHAGLGPLPPQYGGSGIAFWELTIQRVGMIAGPSAPYGARPPVPASLQASVPHFCCTRNGKFGPYPNSSTPVGGQCFVNLYGGPVGGQACN